MPDSVAHSVLLAVEKLGADECGAFVIELDDSELGTLFVDRNRVCWAAAANLRDRLRELLRRQHEATGVDELSARRRALEVHTIESLIALARQPRVRVTWVPHTSAGYQPKFTFAPSELYVAFNAQRYGAEPEGALPTGASLDCDSPITSFITVDDNELAPVRLHGGPLSISQLDELAVWASAAFGVTRGFSREVTQRLIATASGELWLGWRTSNDYTHAAVMTRGASLDRLVGALEAQRIPLVVSRRATSSSSAVRGGLGTVVRDP